jgi:hypothetical protein
MFAARLMTLSALFLTACTQIENDENLDTTEQEGKTRPGSTTTSGPTCAAGTDYMSDANNCGTCGNVCGSGLCYSGTCADATAGHVFAIGHGYETSNPALDKMLGNAVFMNERSTLRVLAYAGTAPSTLVSGTDAAIARQATARGRSVSTTRVTSSADVALNIGNADVFLVYAQPQQDSLYLNYLGDEWGIYLANFARNGGTIIVLDTQSSNVGTAEVLVRTGLMSLSGRSAVSGNAYVSQAEDSIASRVPLMFATSKSVGWAPSASYKNVATSDGGQAIVVHRAMY